MRPVGSKKGDCPAPSINCPITRRCVAGFSLPGIFTWTGESDFSHGGLPRPGEEVIEHEIENHDDAKDDQDKSTK